MIGNKKDSEQTVSFKKFRWNEHETWWFGENTNFYRIKWLKFDEISTKIQWKFVLEIFPEKNEFQAKKNRFVELNVNQNWIKVVR